MLRLHGDRAAALSSNVQIEPRCQQSGWKERASVCFSAAGSFAASGVLSVIGVISLARNSSKPRRMFAAIPLLFAAQQAAEGIVWLTIGDAGHATLHRIAVNAFLGVAFVVWTTWLPFSLRLLESRYATRRRFLTGLFWFGALVAAYAAVLLTLWPPTARVAGHCMTYDHPKIHEAGTVFVYLCGYVIPSVVPFFVSTAALARTIGATLIISLLAAAIVERDALTSVWCFFAAILSCLILVAVTRKPSAGALPRMVPGDLRSTA
jgi:hypothetical protein